MSENVPLASYKLALIMNKRLTNMILFLCIVLIAVVIPYYFLFPLKETNIEFVEFKSGSNNFVTIAKAGKEFTNKQLLISMFLRRYVVDREAVDKTTEKTTRYARVLAFSNNRIGDDFRRTHGGKGSLYFKDNFKRAITIVRDGVLDTGLHQIEFITEDLEDNKGSRTKNESSVIKQEWTVSLEYYFDSQSVSFDTATLNPLGLKIVEYSLSRRKR